MATVVQLRRDKSDTAPKAPQLSIPVTGMPAPKAQQKAKPKPAPGKPAAKAPARPASKPAARRPAPKPTPKASAKPAADPHAGHNMEAGPPAPPAADPHAGHRIQPAQPAAQPPPDPHAGHAMPARPQQPTADPHAGHEMPQQQGSDPHAGHAMPGMAADDAPPVAPPPPEAFLGPEHAAATIYDPTLFARKRREELIEEHGGFVTSMVLIDQFEYRIRDGHDGYKWDGQGWYGGDYNKLWIKSEGEGEFGESPERAEVQALYSRALDPWFNLQVGVRHDFRPEPERTHLVLGVPCGDQDMVLSLARTGIAPGSDDALGGGASLRPRRAPLGKRRRPRVQPREARRQTPTAWRGSPIQQPQQQGSKQ